MSLLQPDISPKAARQPGYQRPLEPGEHTTQRAGIRDLAYLSPPGKGKTQRPVAGTGVAPAARPANVPPKGAAGRQVGLASSNAASEAGKRDFLFGRPYMEGRRSPDEEGEAVTSKKS